MSDIECIWPAEAILSEAPVWRCEEDALYWVDIDGRKVLRIEPGSGRRQVFEQNHEVGCIVPRAAGGFVAGLDAGLAYIDRDLTSVTVFADPEGHDPNTRFNDGKCDRRGRFWVASTDRNEKEPIAALYRLDHDNGLSRVLTGVVVGNGIGWSPDDRTMYFTDSGFGAIYCFDYDIETGAAENRRIFAAVETGAGSPDGLTVDAEGFVWSAHWNGWRVTRYDPEGGVERVFDLPVPHVTSLAFGGSGLDRLFVTTARLGMSGQALGEAPLSGGLFVIECGVRGCPESPFIGLPEGVGAAPSTGVGSQNGK